jgi:hypothetical protein
VTEAEFAHRAAQIGLALEPDDLAELHRGWTGLQPQLVLLREAGLEMTEPPAHRFSPPG